jgi:hypothetical protein
MSILLTDSGFIKKKEHIIQKLHLSTENHDRKRNLSLDNNIRSKHQ